MDEKLIELLTWAYIKGFEAAGETVRETSKTIDANRLKDGFRTAFAQRAQQEKAAMEEAGVGDVERVVPDEVEE